MEIIDLFREGGTASTLLFLSVAGIAGILLGRIKVFRIKLGIAGVLFAGLLIGHLGAHPNHEILHFVKEFGLILFVYSIGMDVGPRFISSLKNNGIRLNMLAAGIVALGVLTAAVLKIALDIPTPIIVGVLCGAVTNTPSLGAAQQIVTEQMAGSEVMVQHTGMAYAVAYPFGVIGIIVTMLLLRALFKVSIPEETTKFQNEVSGVSGKLEAVNLEIVNQGLFGKTVEYMQHMLQGEFVLSRLFRNGKFFMPDEDTLLQQGDVLYGVSSEPHYDSLRFKVGPLHCTGDVEITGTLSMRHVVFTNKKLAGKTIKQIGLSRRFPANITRIFRAGVEILPNEKDTIEFGDTVRVVGERQILKEVADFLGNSMKDLSHPNIIPILIGIFAGILIGSIPITIPGLPAPAKLGLAGGPLIVALFLGHKGRIGKLDFYMTPGANLFIRELGIVLFLACVGISSGGDFVKTIVGGGYMWMIYGAIITLIPLIVIGIIARIMNLNYLSICGLFAGSMTDPPALEFANSIAPVQAQSTAYATVYPLVMFLRVLTAQILVLLFL